MPRQLSATTIRARIRALESQARRLERNATKGLRATAALIVKHGLSLADLRQAFTLSKGKGRRGSALAGRPVPIKYRDGQGNTWTGRGRPPLWLVAAEKAGKKRDSFLIASEQPKPKSKAKAARPKAKKPRKVAAKKVPASSPTAA
jgi:DNA-binding protein H-NS